MARGMKHRQEQIASLMRQIDFAIGDGSRAREMLPVCLVFADKDFVELVALEIEPWYRVTQRAEYDGLARWAQRRGTSAAIVLYIDTIGRDALGGLHVLKELQRLDAISPSFV